MKFLAYTHANPMIQGSGGEKCLQGFLEKLAEKGNDVYCYCSNENKWRKKKVKDVFYDHLKERTLDDILDEIKPDYVITQFFNSKEAIRKSHIRGIRVIYLVHNDFEISTGKELKMLNSTDYVIFNTFWIAKKMLTKAQKFVIHPIIQTKDVKTNRKYITLINPSKAKGASIFGILAMKNQDKEFLAVGGGYGKQENFNRKNIKEIGNTQNIFEDVYAKTKILMMPSMYESYGMCAAEAAYCGIPVIASKTAGLKECLGESGIYVNSLNWIDWNKKLQLLEDDNIYLRYSNLVKNHMQEDFKKEYFENFYKNLKK